VNSYSENTKIDGSHLRANWHRPLEGGGDISLQADYDHTLRQAALFTEKRDTCNLDFQHRFRWGERHELVWGMGYLTTRDNMSSNGSLIALTPPSDTLSLPSAFVQDERRVVGRPPAGDDWHQV